MTATAAPPAAPPFDRRQRLLLAVVIGVAVLLGWLARQPPVTTGGDDSTYLLLAEALRQGRYVDLFLPGTPPHAQYPPGLPLFIAIIQVIAGRAIWVLQVANLALLALTALLVAQAVRRRFSAPLGVAAAALTALNPLLLHYTGWVLSEILFVACATAALCVVAPACRVLRIRHWALAIALALAAFFTRSIGITAVLAIVGGLLVCRRWRLALAGATSLLLLAGWFYYTTWAARQTLGWSYANDLAYVQPTQAFDLVLRLLSSAKYYLVAVPSTAFGVPDIANMPLDNGVWVLLLLALLTVGLWQLWRRWPALVLFTVLCSGVLLVFPFAVLRLMVPLVPVVIVALLVGTRELAAAVGARHPERVALGLAGVLCALALVRDVSAAAEQMRCRRSPTGACQTDGERTWLATAEWLRTSVPSTAVVASAKPSTLYRISGHQGIPSRVLLLGDPADVLAPNGPVTHILMSHLWSYERTRLPAALRHACDRLRKLATPHPEAIVLEVAAPGVAASASGCQALVDFYRPGDEDEDR